MTADETKTDLSHLSHVAEGLRPLATPIDEVTPDPANARTGHDLEGIAASLKLYGQRTPIVANRSQSGRILKGNGTWQAAKRLGWTHVAVVFVEDDPLTATGYAIADNRLGDKSYFDSQVLAALLESLEAPESVPGLDVDFISEVLAQAEADEVELLDEFPEYGEDIETEYRCPKCGYEWSGSPV